MSRVVKLKAKFIFKIYNHVVRDLAFNLELAQMLQFLEVLLNLDEVLRNVRQLFQESKVVHNVVEVVAHDLARQVFRVQDLRHAELGI